MYKDRELLKKAYYNDRDYNKLKAEQDKQKEQRKAEQKRLDRLNYVPENNPIDKGITWVGKGIYNLGKEAIEVGKTTGNTLITAYKITNGSIEVVNTGTDSKTQEAVENSESTNTTTSNSNSIVTTTVKLGKGAIEVGKTTATTLVNAYKISTGSSEIVNTDANGKTQVVIKNSEPNTATSNNNSTTTTNTASHITSNTIELKANNGFVLKLQEKTIKTSLKFKLNNQHIVEIKEYRDITFPDNIEIVPTFFQGIELTRAQCFPLILYELDGFKMTTTDVAFLKLDYNTSGKLAKLSLPNPPVLSSKPLYPACTIYHGKLYTLPVNSGHYNHLTQKIYENGGVVEIGHADPAYHIEAIYD